MEEKKKLELSAVNDFIAKYKNGSRLSIVKHNDKPDFTLIDKRSSEKIGVEVTYLWYDADEAKMRLREPGTHNVMTADELIRKLNKCIKSKNLAFQKYKKHDKFFLVILVPQPAFDKSTFDLFEQSINIDNSQYDEIWLVLFNRELGKWQDLKKLK